MYTFWLHITLLQTHLTPHICSHFWCLAIFFCLSGKTTVYIVSQSSVYYFEQSHICYILYMFFGVNSTFFSIGLNDRRFVLLYSAGSTLCTKKKFIYERSISKKQLFLEIIERIGCTKSIQPSKEVRIVGHSVLD